MANRTLQSSNVTFLDQTDDKQLDLYISSNHPNVQIFNTTSGSYTPDWSKDNLKLTVEAYIDTTKITNGLDVVWYQNSISDATRVGTGTTLTISTNALSDKAIITYICKVTHDGVQASKDITFSKTETGTHSRFVSITGLKISMSGWVSERTLVSG